jgi:hypothetical protein
LHGDLPVISGLPTEFFDHPVRDGLFSADWDGSDFPGRLKAGRWGAPALTCPWDWAKLGIGKDADIVLNKVSREWQRNFCHELRATPSSTR